MTNIDQFESVFKSADKRPYVYEPLTLENGLIVTDLDDSKRPAYLERVKNFFTQMHPGPVQWTDLGANDYHRVNELLDLVRDAAPDFVISYRNLHLPAGDFPYSLGVHLDVLTQATTIPVLVTPIPEQLEKDAACMATSGVVMAITDHMAQDHHLVSFAAQLTPSGGTLWLTHVEDQATFDRYIDTIGRIPSIDTDNARKVLLEQLLKEPADYIDSCRDVLMKRESITVQNEVVAGRLLDDYKRLVASHNVSLLVMNTKDEQQLAMHGMAYPLTIELRDTPLMLI